MVSIWLPIAAAQVPGGPDSGFRCRRNAVTHGSFNYNRKLLPRDAALCSSTSLGSVACAASPFSFRTPRPMAMASSQAQELQRREFSYMFRCERGDLVKVVVVGAKGSNIIVHIEVLSSFKDELLLICETSNSVPLPIVPVAEKEGNLMKIPLFRNSYGRYTLDLEFDSRNPPFYFSFLLHTVSDAGAVGREITTHRKTTLRVPVGLGPGHPGPLGVSISDGGVANFSLFSRSAKSVILCLYDGKTEGPSLEIELDPYLNRTGDIWHVSVEGIGYYVGYGYRCKGTVDKGGALNERCVLLDPYSKRVLNLLPGEGESMAVTKFLGSLEKEPIFDWGGDVHPCLPMEKLVVYRLNVRQFTEDQSSRLPEDVAGTFMGVGKKVQHFKELGVNAVLLEPIFPFNVQRGAYFPYHFFSVTDGYRQEVNAASAINSLKEMIKTLHSEGMEVLLEVVFTHTGEGRDAGSQVISFRGIDSASYYVVEGKNASKATSLKSSNPVVQQLIIDSLRHWVVEFHVDGFCFINSSVMAQGDTGIHLSRPPLIEAIAFDPVLSKTKIIADCWSPLDMSYNEIQFPHWKRWAEMNTRYCTGVRNFLRGKGLLSDFTARLCGSGDLFSSRGPAFSFNFVTRNFGLTLLDLVSFSSDVLAPELSWNCGEEGPSNDKTVLETRLKQIRNLLFVLFVSFGVPVLNMGDECNYSTGGSPLYSDRQPMDWVSLGTNFGKQITQFISFLSSLRMRRSAIFHSKHFLEVENIVWYGSTRSEPRWNDPTCKFIAVALKSETNSETSSSSSGDLFICFNASRVRETVILPEQPEGNVWLRLVDTSLSFPGFFSSSSHPDLYKVEGLSAYELKPHSCALFEAQKITALNRK